MLLSYNYLKPFILIIFTLILLFPAALPFPAEALHFPDPPYHTFSWADFMGSLKINGQPAQPGDEVAFFDPQGVLSGHFVISSNNGTYGTVHVYGDDPSTSLIDEGAVSGDLLTVKIWDSKAGQELEGNVLTLSVSPVWQSMGSSVLNIETATHFPKPVVSPASIPYVGYLTIMGKPAEIGDEIAVFDPNGVLCGQFTITGPGENGMNYGIMHIYGDDTSSPSIDEGAGLGDILTFKVWTRKDGIEYSGSRLRFSAGQAIGSFGASSIPPAWTTPPDTEGNVLNIEVLEGIQGDLNGDGTADLSDAVLAVKVLAGLNPSGLRPDYATSNADVAGNKKIGLPEAIYLLQKAAHLRP